MNGASSFDLTFRGFHRPVTAPRPHFKLLQFSLKIKYLGTLKYDTAGPDHPPNVSLARGQFFSRWRRLGMQRILGIVGWGLEPN